MNANDMNEMANMYQKLRSNPKEVLCSKFNISDNIDMNNPSIIIQYLLNTGQITQEQVNNVMKVREAIESPFLIKEVTKKL